MKKLPFIVLVIVLGMLAVVLFTSSSQNNKVTQTIVLSPTPSPLPPAVPQTSLWLEHEPTIVAADGTITLDGYIRSKENLVNKIQLEISYDPKVLQYVSIKGSDYLGGKKVYIKNIDTVKGKISFASGIGPNDPPIQGTDEIAKIVFRPLVLNGAVTDVTLLPESSVMANGTDKSVLTDVRGTSLKLSPGGKQGE